MNEPIVIPPTLAHSFRRIAEGQGAAIGAEVEIGHLTRQSLAALRFVEADGHRVRFDHGRKSWFIWSGHRWHPDLTSEIRRMWLGVLSRRFREALTIADSEARERTVAAIQAAGALDTAIDAGLRIAASAETVAMAGHEWDPDAWSLGCDNGILDLRTAQLRAGRPEDLVTRSTHLAFDPNAACPRWERFLVEVFAADAELIAWFRRLIGATFVGMSKEVMALNHGYGNNGKSVAYKTLLHVAGDYGVDIGIETLIGRRRDAGAPTSDLMRMRGARLAFTSEPDQAARLGGAAIKRLATIDKMVGRELHGRQQEWEPTHTLHLATNHPPEIDDASDGAWRRLAVISWPVKFLKAGEDGDGPREDPGLLNVLQAEAPGILAWVARGAVEYARAGSLHPFPPSVVLETASYRAEEDPLLEFFLERIEPADDDRIVTVTALHADYLAWTERTAVPKIERLNSKRFGRMFKQRHTRLGWPVTAAISSGRAAYRGLRIRAADPTVWPAPRADGGGDGGFGEAFVGVSRAPMESERTGESPSKPTKPTNWKQLNQEEVAPTWDDDLAERATDDDAEDG